MWTHHQDMEEFKMSRRKSVENRREQSTEALRIRMGYVVLLFAAAFLVRTLLAFLFREAPIVVIDESLYTNIARSLAWEGKLAYRGQPIDYPYLFYPLLLTPVYWLQSLLGGDIYRFIQVYNTLLITSSVFPAFLFARDFTGDDRKALLSALVVALMPDMLLGAYLMTECVLWPLALWLIFFAYRMFSERGARYGYLTALFAGLMFFTKPGAIVMGAVLLVIRLIEALIRNRKAIVQVIGPILLLAAIAGLTFLVYKLLYPAQSSLIGLYDKQTSNWRASDALVAAEATLLTVFLFTFACCGVFGIVPFAFIRDYECTERRFILSFSCGVLASILGTAVFVVPYTWDSSLGALPLHLRYCSMFIPAYFIFSVHAQRAKGKIGKPLKVALILFAVLCIFPGARSGFVKDFSSSIDSLTLNSFYTTPRLEGDIFGTILTVLTVLFVVFLLFSLSLGWTRKVVRVCTAFLVVFLLYNNVCAYVNTNVPIDSTISADALEVNAVLDEEYPCLGVTQRHYDDIYSYWLESRLSKPMQQVTIDQMFSEMQRTGGIYEPFTPIDQSPNVGNGLTTDSQTLILGKTIAEHLELSDSVRSEVTTNGHFTIAYITKGERWVDSMMYGMAEDVFYADAEGMIQIFDAQCNIDGNVHLHITASGSGTLVVGGTSIELTPTETTYDLTLPFNGGVIPFSCDQDVIITGYTTDRAA